MNKRDEAIKAMSDGVGAPLPSFDDWEIVPLEENGEIIGGVMIKGNELHVAYKRRPVRSIRAYIRQTLGRVLKSHECAVTTVRRTNINGINFCLRLGFRATEIKNGIWHMECSRTDHV